MVYDEENIKKRTKRDLGLLLVSLPIIGIIIIIMEWEIVLGWFKNLFE
jgi:hypothetical protein